MTIQTKTEGPDEEQLPGCLPGFLIRILRKLNIDGAIEDTRQEMPLPYRRRQYLLSQGERVFYGALCHAIDGGRYRVFCKVRLGDLLYVAKGTEERRGYTNRIQMKHVDFVICTSDLLRPVIVVELDDRSHERADRRERDAFVDAALRTAGLPIVHVQARSAYDPNAIKAALMTAIGEAESL